MNSVDGTYRPHGKILPPSLVNGEGKHQPFVPFMDSSNVVLSEGAYLRPIYRCPWILKDRPEVVQALGLRINIRCENTGEQVRWVWWILVRSPGGCAVIGSDGVPIRATRSQTQRLFLSVTLNTGHEWCATVGAFGVVVLLLDER
jgi:hypothetical protein